MTGFGEGWAWGSFVGGMAFLIGVLVHLVATHVGLPVWACAGLGAWAFLVAVAVGQP